VSKLTVEIRHRDGRRETVSIAEAIVISEKRRDAARDEAERLHCERRILELQSRWKRSLRVERAKTSASAVKPSERPTKTRTRRRALRVVRPDEETR